MKNWKTVGRKLLKAAAFAVMAVMVFVGGVTTSELLRREEAQQIGGVQTGNSLQAEQTINNGISLMAANGTAYVRDTLGQSVPYGALNVTASVTPTMASNQKLTWSFAWAGTVSSWSSGKTVSDYFNLEYVGTNAHEIYVWATQPFGDQIIVTATSTDGTNKTATMTVDFAKRMSGITAISGFGGDYNSTNDRASVVFDFYAGENASSVEEIEYTASYSVGSKDLTWKLVSWGIEFNPDFQSAVENAGFGKTTNRVWETSIYTQGWKSAAHNIFTFDDSKDLFFDGGSDNVANQNKLKNCITACNGYIGWFYFNFESTETDSLGNKYR